MKKFAVSILVVSCLACFACSMNSGSDDQAAAPANQASDPATYDPTTYEAGYAPKDSEVGPRYALTSQAGGKLAAGTFDRQEFTAQVELSSKTGSYVFTDCSFAAGIKTVDGRGVTDRPVLLDHCVMGNKTGLYFEYGGQTNWTLKYCKIVGDRKAFRPSGTTGQSDMTTPTPCTVEDSIFSITLTGTPTNHVDTMQSLGGNGLTFTRVRFITPGPYVKGTTGQTSAVNNGSSDTTFTSCEFLEEGAFYYTVYSNGSHVLFKNCRIIKGLAGYLYPDSTIMPTLTDCTDYATDAAVTN